MGEIKEITAKMLQFREERDWKQFHSAKNLAMCVFRPKPITDSAPSRSLIPLQADHRFRSKPIADCAAGE